MAEETLITASPFFGSVNKAVLRLEETDGPLFAALLVHVPEHAADDWVFLAGSSRLGRNRIDGIDAIVRALETSVPKKLLSRISRVDVLRTEDPIFVHLSQAFRLEPGSSTSLLSSSIFGLEFDHAVLFVMRSATPKSGKKAKPRSIAARRRAKI